MNQLPPKARVVVVDEDGAEHSLTRPSLGAVADMEQLLEEARAKNSGGAKIILAFIMDCGLPEAVARGLDDSQIEALMTLLTPSKKK